MNPAAKDILDLLDGESSVGLTKTTDLFYSRMPDDPDQCVVLYDTEGGPPMLTLQKSTSGYRYSGVTVRARATQYAIAYGLLEDVITFLHGHSSITIDGTYYAVIKALNDPQILHYDNNDRPVLFVNFDIQRRE